MHNINRYLMILYLVAFSLICFLLQATPITGSSSKVPEVEHETRIGVILDQTSRPGKEAKVAIELAIQDLNIKAGKRWVLYLQNSRNKPVHSASAAKELIREHKVKAIVGAQTWEEASTIAEVISDHDESDHNIPVFLSLASSFPQQQTNQWPFFIQAVPTQSTHMSAIAALLKSLDIRQVTLIHETSLSAFVMSNFYQTFQKTDFELTHIVPLASGSSSLYEELEAFKKQKLNVFVMHTSLELAVRIFQTAKKMEMIGDTYLWIATNGITDLFHSIDSTMISSLRGMIGVKTYYPENTHEFPHFKKRFHRKFIFDYPEEEQDEPGIFAVQGYNTVKMLEKHLPDNFHKWKPKYANVAEIVNVVGKGYNSVYWTEGLGFSETVKDDINEVTSYTHSIDNVGQVLWFLQPWYANNKRRRNQEKTSPKPMRVGVPCKSLFREFVDCDSKTDNKITGFSIEVFREMMGRLDGDLITYDLIPSNHYNYEDLMDELYSEKYDAIAGDLTITENRLNFANFTQPYTASGLEMIVPVRSNFSNQAWLFLKPFTIEMWWLIALITTYNGFVIWLIERSHVKSLQGSVFTEIGIILWLAFSQLFTLRGDKMHSNLSRMSVVVWFFVAVVIIQSYTASLASMLTVQRLEPTISSVEMLRNKNATVGYCHGSFVDYYLRIVFGFNDVKTLSYNSTLQYAEALNSKQIAAIFLEVPVAKVFLGQYGKSFIRTGETYKAGGFGFAFGKGFTRLPDANKALMNLSESRKLKELEEKYLNYGKCVDEECSRDETEPLSIHSFWVLFILTVGTSTFALTIYIIMSINEFRKSVQEQTNIFNLMALIKEWQRRRRLRQSSGTVSQVEIN